MSWLFPEGEALPPGYFLQAHLPAADESGEKRLAVAEELLGRESSHSIARKLGAYELEESLALKIQLEGIALGKEGEIPALSPNRWGRFPEALSRQELLDAISEGGLEIAGLIMSEENAATFGRFLAARKIKESAPPEKIAALARHFFHGQPINLVLRPSTTH